MKRRIQISAYMIDGRCTSSKLWVSYKLRNDLIKDYSVSRLTITVCRKKHMSIIQSDNLSQHLTGKKDLTTISQNIRTIVQCKSF